MGYSIRSSKLALLFSFKGKKSSMREEIKDTLLSYHDEVMVVPKGSLAVYVGDDLRRFIIPLSYLYMPAFRELMERVAEEFGYNHTEHGLRIPCEEEDFIHMLNMLKKSKPKKPKKSTLRSR